MEWMASSEVWCPGSFCPRGQWLREKEREREKSEREREEREREREERPETKQALGCHTHQ